MNMADSERMAGQLESLGFREAKTDKEVKQAKVRSFNRKNTTSRIIDGYIEIVERFSLFVPLLDVSSCPSDD
jgi:hypothetical protein